MIDLVRRGQTNVYGQVSVTLKGRSLKQELDYNRDTWEEWTKVAGIVSESTGLEITANGTSVVTTIIDTNLKSNTKYGLLYRVVFSSITSGIFGFGSGSRAINFGNGVNAIGNQKAISTSFNPITNNTFAVFVSNTVPSGEKVKLKDIRIFELPAGSEIESDFNTMTADQLAQKYPYINGDSVKSTNSVRVKSVGKNLFDSELELGAISDSTGQIYSSNDRLRTKKYIKVKPNSEYSLSNDLGYSFVIHAYDQNQNWIRQLSGTNSFTTTENTKYIRFRSGANQNNLNVKIQLEEGTTATPYEPHKESISYINGTGELRSLPNGVKDEYNATGGVKTQNVSAPFIVNGDLPWKYYGDKIGSKQGYLEDITVFCPNIKRVVNYSYPGTFVLRDKNNATVAEMGNSSKDGVHEFQLPLSGGTRLYVNIPDTLSGWAEDVAPTIQQIKDYFNANPYALTYQLAEPVVTQLDPQPLTIFPNGTQYIEFGTKEVAEYADGINISNAEIPIKAMKTVDKLHIEDGHWKRTAIDLANVAVSPDGLSFTIADAVNGETYEYSYDYDSALSTLPDLEVGEPSLVTRNNRTIVL